MTVHNRKKQTLQCLSHLYAQERALAFDVYMTDDGCTDATAEAVGQAFPAVHVIPGDGTLYWNGGMRLAWQVASQDDYDYYLWLNDDTFVYPYMMYALVQASAEVHETAIVVGATQDQSLQHRTYGGYLVDNRPAEVDGHITKIDYFNGNIVLVPRSVYQTLGNLDPYFRHAKGDFDYGLRAKKAGIHAFQLGCYLGICEEHPRLDTWCDPEVPFLKRWRAIWQPNGMIPWETFYFERRHSGLFVAAFHTMTVMLRCFFPKLWQT